MKLKSAVKSGHPPSLFAAFLHFDVSFMVWVLVGALGAYISADLDLTASQKGLMVALPILGGSIFRIILGLLTDRFGPKRVGLVSMTFVLAPLAFGWLVADSYAQVLMFGLFLGIAGASFAVSLPLASRWYPPEHQGLAMGIAGAGNSGTVFAVLFAPMLAEQWGWQAVFGLAMIPVGLTALAFGLLAKEAPQKPLKQSIFAPFKRSDTWWFNFFYAITFGGFVGLSSYLSIFFVDQYGLSKVSAGYFAAFAIFGGSFFRPVGGYLADRFGGLRMLMLLYGTAGLLMAGVALLPSLPVVATLLFCGMMALGMGNGSVFQLVPQRFSREIGVVSGIVGAAGGVGGFLLPFSLGLLKDATGTYAAGFVVFSAVAFAGLSGVVVVGRWWKAWALPKVAQPLPVTQGHLSANGRVAMEVVFGG